MRLSGNNLKFISMGFSYKLLSLQLDHNRITDDCMKLLVAQVRLGEGNHEQKVWYECPISGDAKKGVGQGLWAMKKLSLARNELTDASLKYLRSLLQCFKEMEQVQIQDNLIVYADPLRQLQNELYKSAYLQPGKPICEIMWKPSDNSLP